MQKCVAENVGGGEAIIPYTEDEARDWIAEYCSVDTYIEYFGMPEE